jgi:thioredoxin 1
MSDEVKLTDDNFEETVGKSEGLFLVDFYADWCMPCRMLAPHIEEIAKEYAGRVTVGKLDVDKSGRTAAGFSISGIPTVILFQDGAPVERLTGLQTVDALKAVIDKHLS